MLVSRRRFEKGRNTETHSQEKLHDDKRTLAQITMQTLTGEKLNYSLLYCLRIETTGTDLKGILHQTRAHTKRKQLGLSSNKNGGFRHIPVKHHPGTIDFPALVLPGDGASGFGRTAKLQLLEQITRAAELIGDKQNVTDVDRYRAPLLFIVEEVVA